MTNDRLEESPILVGVNKAMPRLKARTSQAWNFEKKLEVLSVMIGLAQPDDGLYTQALTPRFLGSQQKCPETFVDVECETAKLLPSGRDLGTSL